MHSQTDPGFAADALQQLSSVSRFSMLAAMLPKADLCFTLSHSQTDPGFTADALQQLSGVSRFSMLAAMLPKADKAIVKEVLAALEAASINKAVVDDVAKKYRV